jgi:hypothetical protein
VRPADFKPRNIAPVVMGTRARMAVLSDQGNRAVVERRQNDCAAGVVHHFADVGCLAFADSVDGDIENASSENLPGINQFRSLGLRHSSSLVCAGSVGNTSMSDKL